MKLHTWKKTVIIIGGLVTIFYLLYSIYISYHDYTVKMIYLEKKEFYKHDTKYILYWTKMWGFKDFYLGMGSEPFRKCEVKNCFATDNRELIPLENFNALLFHGVEYERRTYGIPWIRNVHQRYVFVNMEAPLHQRVSLKPFKSFYNWTMTYRFNSDIQRPYGYVIHKNSPYTVPSIDFVQNKTLFAAWFVSNCVSHSAREKLASQLSQYIPVDVYGHCGKRSCSKNDQKHCYDMLEKRYKFYFSFENSYCIDYVTEKVFDILKRNIIPVVFGGANYSKMFPPYSVINVDDFTTIQELVYYLKELGETPSKYLKYFEWKQKYTLDTTAHRVVCDLCKKLNGIEPNSVYEDIDEWWRGSNKSVCLTENDLPKISFRFRT